MPEPPKMGAMPPPPNINATWFFTLLNMLNIPLFYFNSEILIPKVLNKKGIGLYVLTLLLAVAITFTLNGYGKELLFGHPMSKFPRTGTLFQTLFVLAVSTSFRMILDNLRHEERRQEQENERLKSELSFLRSQISPHFMFNVLNSIVSLSRRKPTMVEPVVIKLSELMRYMLYESDDMKVSLEKEIQYLNSYIDLQMIRFGDDIKISFDASDYAPQMHIEPMLIIPFVENAFKHGVGMILAPEIRIHLCCKANTLIFEVQNKINPQSTETKDHASGIGLTNVKRRLALLYPQMHQLHIEQDNDWYKVHLEITT